MKNNKIAMCIALFICSCTTLFGNSPENQLAAIPQPSWFSKSPLACKPAGDWWQTEQARFRSTIDQTPHSTITLASLNQHIATYQPIHELPELSIIVPDAWVPWESDPRYLQLLPSMQKAAFIVDDCTAAQANKEATYENPEITVYKITASTGDSNNCITHLYCPLMKQLFDNQSISQEAKIENLSVMIEALVKASVLTQSSELVLPLDCAHLELIAKALHQKNVFDAIKQWHVHLTLIYRADIFHRSVKQDIAAFIDLLAAVDGIKATCYRTDKPIHLVLLSYLTWLYTYEAEKAHRSIKRETEDALHHVADQISVLLKKLISTNDITFDKHYTQERPIIIISIPKAGNHLLGEAISLMTGRKLFWPGDVHGKELDEAIAHMDDNHFMFVHVAHRAVDVEIIKKHNPILFFMYRDPRDLAVSTALFRQHWIFWDGKPRNDFALLLTECITTFVAPWYADATKLQGMAGLYDALMPWVTYPGVLAVKFEDIIGAQGGGSASTQRTTIKRVAEHLGISYTDNLIDYVVDHIFGNGLTFRNGHIGSWKDNFSKQDIALFKESMGQWLIDWGYEQALNW